MNATPPIFHAPRTSDTARSNAPASPAQASQTGSRDFAATLKDAGARPVRKHASAKHSGTPPNGNPLPAAGNQPPPALGPPPPAQTEVPAGAQAKDAAGAAVAAGVPGSAGAAGPAAGAQAGKADPTSNPVPTVAGDATAEPKAVSAPVVTGDAAFLLAADSSGTAAATSAAGAAASAAEAATSATAAAVSDSAAVAPPSPSMPAAHTGATADPKPTDPQIRATPRDATKSDAALTASTSRPASADANAVLNDQTLSGGPAAPDSDAAAQAAVAAAIAQAGAPTNNSSATADDTVVPDSGISLQGTGAANEAPLAAPTVPTAPHAPSAASAISAAAAAVVQATQGAADAGAADRHSRDNSPDSSLSASTNDGTAGAAQLLTSNAPTDSAPLPTFKIPAGVDTADFGQGLADRVSLMMDGSLSSAKLQVNPPALGPIEVRIALQGGHAQVWLSSHSAVTRDALESSAPKLREMLGSQGFAQVSVDISQRSFQERSPQSHAYEAAPPIGDSPAISPASTAILRAANGLLDAYA